MSNRVLAVLSLACIARTAAFAQSEDWRSRMEQGNALRRAGSFKESLIPFREAVRILEAPSPDAIALTAALNLLGLTFADLGQLGDAEQYYRRALAVAEKVMGVESVGRAQILVNLADVYLQHGRFADAERMIAESLQVYSSRVPPDSIIVAVARACLAQALLGQRDSNNAIAAVDQALLSFEKEPAANPGYYGMSLNTKGAIRWSQARPEEAAALFQRSIAAIESQNGPKSPLLLYPLNNLAAAKQRAGHPDQAAALLSRSIAVAETNFGTKHPLYGELLMNYATCLKLAGRKSEAKTIKTRAAAILKGNALNTGAGMIVDISTLRPN